LLIQPFFYSLVKTNYRDMAFIRITAGNLGGRRIRVLDRTGLRPTQDRVRQAIFSSLGAKILDARVLDLCAGTGASGIEAWSRGAAWVTWLESDRSTVKRLQENLRELQVPAKAGAVLCRDVFQALNSNNDDLYDVIFADPPYPWTKENYQRLLAAARKVANDGACCVLETASRFCEDLQAERWKTISVKKYGDTKVHYFEAV
jgi:16S rRNA (guanine966-N2)-methyltransferase